MRRLTTLADFEALKKGDIVCCEWHLDSYENNRRTRFNTYKVAENKKRAAEIILTIKDNVYFNIDISIDMFLNGDSNLKDIVLLYPIKKKEVIK